MEELPENLIDAQAALPLNEEASWHQRRLDAADSRSITKLAIAIGSVMNGRLHREIGLLPNEPILFKDRGYFEDPWNLSLTLREDDGTYFYGQSEGVCVLPVPTTYNDRAIRLLVVHSVAVIAQNSIPGQNGHRTVATAHIPVSSHNFRLLRDEATAFVSQTSPEDNRSEQLINVAQDFSNCRNQVFIKNRIASGPAAIEASARIDELEALVGPRGCGLVVESPYAYSVDADRSGIMRLRPTTCLRGKAQYATFLGISDFAAFDRRLVAVDYQRFNYDLHDGLFMGLALSDLATARAGLKRQALLIPLSGNDFKYHHP